ncbi:DUF6602 domain-containing protein (plasmid) [Streptomyces sp. CWNU-52B]|uniref:DUF6602 domain-containing protein n=1 Tax=unclassified Streptomyces TaxID=2593676 RepID=UPI0039C153F3
MSKIVEQYWSGVARRLQEEVDTFNKLIGHAGEQGRENELSLVRLLRNLLPTNVGVGSGMVIDSFGGISKQTDIIIYSSSDQPSILAQTTQAIYPVENVMMTIEVKTTLDDEEIRDCAGKYKKQKELRPANGNPPPSMMVLAYNAEGMLSTVAKQLRTLDQQERPDALCVVNPGILATTDSMLAGQQGDYVIGLAALHSRDSSGERISETWERPNAEDRGKVALRLGLPHPVGRTTPRNESRILGDPGRALLIFCSIILNKLSKVSTLPPPTLSHYMQGTALELFPL